MYSVGLLALVAVACLIALQNWRMGLLLCVVVGLLQDPIRKVTPGTPAYLVMAFVPVYAAMFVALLNERAVLRDFFRRYPQAVLVGQLFFFCIAFSCLQTLTYAASPSLSSPAAGGGWGGGAVPRVVSVILVGLTFYFGWIPPFFLRY